MRAFEALSYLLVKLIHNQKKRKKARLFQSKAVPGGPLRFSREKVLFGSTTSVNSKPPFHPHTWYCH